MFANDTQAVSCVALTKFVTIACPFQSTVELDENPVPFTVSVPAGFTLAGQLPTGPNPAPVPPVIDVGLIETIASGGGGALTVKLTELEVTPPDCTLIEAVPGFAIRLAETEAVNCVALLNVVGSDVVFQKTLAWEANPVPVTVKVKAAAPAVAPLGFKDVIAGPDTTVKLTEFEVTPPEVTVT